MKLLPLIILAAIRLDNHAPDIEQILKLTIQ